MGMRGSSALAGAADSVIECGAAEKIVTVTPRMQKNHPTGQAITLRAVTAGESIAMARYRGGLDGGNLTEGCLTTLRALSEIQVPFPLLVADLRLVVPWSASSVSPLGMQQARRRRMRSWRH